MNGHDARVDTELICLLRVLGYVFGEEFWSHTAFIFTKLPMNQKEIQRRKRNSNDDVQEVFRECLKKKFPSSCHSKILVMDAHYDEKDESERKAFVASLNVVKALITCSSLLTARSCSEDEEAFEDYIETTRKITKKDYESEKFRKLQAESPYNVGLERLWGGEAFEKLKSHVRDGKITLVHIQNFANHVA